MGEGWNNYKKEVKDMLEGIAAPLTGMGLIIGGVLLIVFLFIWISDLIG